MSDVVTVVFLGLISHMNLSNNNTAVLATVRKPLHHASMKIERPGESSFTLDIDGLRIHIQGSSKQAPDQDPSYQDRVPHIGRMLGCVTDSSLKAQIQDKSHHLKSADISAYVDYEGDRLSAPDLYCDRVKFNGAVTENAFHCIASKVVLTAQPPTGGKDMYLTMQKIGVEDDDPAREILPVGTTVTFVNAPDDDDSITVGDHFHEYLKLVDGCSRLITTAVEKNASDDKCPKCKHAEIFIVSDDFRKKLPRRQPKHPRTTDGQTKRARPNEPPPIKRLQVTVECADSQYP